MYGRQKYGGITRYFTESLSRLGAFDDDIQIIFHLPRNCLAEVPKAKWIHEIRDTNLKPERLFGKISKARTLLKRPGIFHSTYYTRPYWSDMKKVVTVYDFIDEKFPLMRGNPLSLSIKKRFAIENADAVIAISESTKNDILTFTHAKESNISVIHLGANDCALQGLSLEIEVAKFREKYNLHCPYWLFVGNRGRSSLYKNFGSLLRAFARLSSRTDGCLVVVGGESKFEPWQVDFLIANRIERRVRLIPGISRRNLQRAYMGATAFIFPSLAEGFGLPLLEAMTCGAPVIASDIPVFHEIADGAALYFNPNDHVALSDAMLKALDDTVRKKLVEDGKKRVSNFSWDQTAKKLVHVYQSIY